MNGNTDMHLLVTDTLNKKGRGVNQKTSQYLVWPPFTSCSVTHLLISLLIVACGMLSHSSSMAVRSCWILAGTGTQYTLIQSIANMLNGWQVWWVCKPWKNWGFFSFKELYTDPCDMGLCIIMLKHEVMAADEWHDNGPQDFVTCVQISIDKMQLCSLSVAYVCPYHNPTATMGHSPILWRRYQLLGVECTQSSVSSAVLQHNIL